MSILTNELSFGLVLAAAAFSLPAGIFVGFRIACAKVRPVLDRLERVEQYFLPKKRMEFSDEEDHDGRAVDASSPFEQCLYDHVRRSDHGLVTVRQRVLTEIVIKEAVLRKELMDLRQRGDGKWLGTYLDRVYSQPARAKELHELRNRHAAKGWHLVCVEPAYDSGDGLFVWLELEKKLDILAAEKSAA
jgi:hypothetical protein